MTNPYSAATVKKSAAFFLGGKFLSGGITFITVLWLVRALPLQEYGVYVFMPLLIDMFSIAASLGIPWIIARYLPELRLNASGAELNLFLKKALLLSLLARLLLIAVIFACAGSITRFLNIGQYEAVFTLYLVVILLESLSRLLRESVLSSLLMQREAQISLVFRSALFLGLLISIDLAGEVTIRRVVYAELIATCVGLMLAIWATCRFCWHHRDALSHAEKILPGWNGLWKTARVMYLGQLVALAYSNQAFVLLTQRFLGVEYTAVFGFMVNLYSQVFRYLPVVMLFNVFRPKWVANYVNGGGFQKLRMDTNLAVKLTVFTLMPMIVLISVQADDLLSLLSGGQFVDYGVYFAVVMLALIPHSQKNVLEVVAVILEDRAAIFIASMSCILIFPAAYMMFAMGWGLWAPVISMLAVHLMFNGLISLLLFRNTGYYLDYKGLLKIFGVSALLIFVFLQVPATRAGNPLTALLVTLAVCAAYLVLLYYIKPFSLVERNAINHLLKRRLFYW